MGRDGDVYPRRRHTRAHAATSGEHTATMGRTPTRLREITYALSPMKTGVMHGLFKDWAQGMGKRVSENAVDAGLFCALPLAATVWCVSCACDARACVCLCVCVRAECFARGAWVGCVGDDVIGIVRFLTDAEIDVVRARVGIALISRRRKSSVIDTRPMSCE